MRELYDFDKLVNQISESQDVIDANDYGAFINLDSINPVSGLSFMDEMMSEFIGDVVSWGMPEEKAVNEVMKAVDELIASNALDEMPNETSSDGYIAQWLFNSKPKIKAHLKLIGLIY